VCKIRGWICWISKLGTVGAPYPYPCCHSVFSRSAPFSEILPLIVERNPRLSDHISINHPSLHSRPHK